MASENACALQSQENIINQNKTLLELCSTDIIKHFGTNFVILNIS